jgi:hypothetical protein
VRDVVRDLEEALGRGAARVDDALGDALAVEDGQLLDQLVVLEKDGACVGVVWREGELGV